MSRVFIDDCHAQNVLQRMWEQCENEQYCDVVLIAGPEETRIPAHRAVLCASSDFFKTMFTAPFKESTAREAKVPSVDGETLKSLVKYSYSGRIEIKEEIVEKLLISADSLLLGAVVNACGEFLAEQLHPTNCLGIAQLADRHLCESLSKKAKKFCMEYFVDLYKTDEFLSLNDKQLGQLLASDDLCVPNEAVVFKSLMAWLEHDLIEREQYKDDLLKLVRMPLIKPAFLIERVRPVCTTDASRQLYDAATDWHLLPGNRTLEAMKLTKPRQTKQCLMAITMENEKLNILYHCPQQLKWLTCLEDLVYRTDFSVAVMDNDLFIVGGHTQSGFVLNTVICLSLEAMVLKVIKPMNECGQGVAVAALKGFLYAVGGKNGNCYLNSVQKWDPQLNNWSTVASMAIGRDSCALAILNGKLYVVGGYTGSVLSSVEYYDPQVNAWSTVASMCKPRRSPGAAVVDGMLYAVGGLGSKTIERYDPKTNMWTLICSLSETIYAGMCTSFYDKLVVLYNDRVENYSAETNKWKVNASIAGLNNAYHIFSYSGELLVSKFVEKKLKTLTI